MTIYNLGRVCFLVLQMSLSNDNGVAVYTFRISSVRHAQKIKCDIHAYITYIQNDMRSRICCIGARQGIIIILSVLQVSTVVGFSEYRKKI